MKDCLNNTRPLQYVRAMRECEKDQDKDSRINTHLDNETA